MGNNEIDDLLKNYLGSHAFNNTMQVQPDYQKLCLAISYLTIQIDITKRWCDESGKEHVNTVINETIKILTPKINGIT